MFMHNYSNSLHLLVVNFLIEGCCVLLWLCFKILFLDTLKWIYIIMWYITLWNVRVYFLCDPQMTRMAFVDLKVDPKHHRHIIGKSGANSKSEIFANEFCT